MLFKSKPLAFFAVAAALYVTYLLYNTGALHGISEGVARFDKGAGEAGKEAQPATPSLSSSSASPLPPQSAHNLAIATFLTGQTNDDTYFNSTRLLAYQLLHDPSTRITNHNITFVVLCGKALSEEKADRLRKDGATIIRLDDVELPSWIHTGEERWSEQFTKLRVFERTEFGRLLYIDADYMLMHPLDDIFEDPIVKTLSPTLFSRDGEIKEDEGPLPKHWLFAARSENGGIDQFDHTVPPLQTNYANAGFFLIAPDRDMYSHLMTVMHIEDRFSTGFMEQDMLNYVFRRDGPMPWRELNWKWSANFVNEQDLEFGIHSLHGKFWKEGPQEAQDRWQRLMKEMIQFHEKSQA